MFRKCTGRKHRTIQIRFINRKGKKVSAMSNLIKLTGNDIRDSRKHALVDTKQERRDAG